MEIHLLSRAEYDRLSGQRVQMSAKQLLPEHINHLYWQSGLATIWGLCHTISITPQDGRVEYYSAVEIGVHDTLLNLTTAITEVERQLRFGGDEEEGYCRLWLEFRFVEE